MASSNHRNSTQPLSPGIVEPHFRLVFISILAAIIGLGVGVVAFILYRLIGLVSNLVFFQRFEFEIPSIQSHQLGLLVILVPVVGGLIVGVMAKYGTRKIRGHGIPEAIEAVLENRSRIAPNVAILKPLSAAIAINTAGPVGAEGPMIPPDRRQNLMIPLAALRYNEG